MRHLPRRLREDPLARAVAALDPDPRRATLAVLAGTAALSCAIGLMAVSGWLISRAAQQPPVLFLQVAVVATRAFGIGRGVLRYVERLISHDVALRGVAALRERLYRHLAAADAAAVTGLRRGDLLARLGADVDTLADVVVRSLLPFAVAWTTLTGVAVLVAVLLPPAGLVVAVAMVLAAVVAPWLASRAARRAEEEAAQARSELSAETMALLDGLAELTVTGAVPDRLHRSAELDDTLGATLDAAARPAAWAAGLSTLATGLAMVAALALGAAATAAGRMDEVLLAVVTLTPLAAAEAVAALPAAAAGTVRARAAARRVLDLLDTPARAITAEGAGDPHAPAIEEAHLRADRLSCGWPGRDVAVAGVDLDLPPGRHVAVVGGSGDGKTTLLLTLAGLLPPRAGEVTLSGTGQAPSALGQLPEPVARRTVSFTAEDAHVFTTTVRENVRVALPDAADDAVHAALARAGLAGWVQALPAGLDTMLGSGGAGMSGGERRRLLLARAFLLGAGVLLLDEPGEHLDPPTADALVRDVLGAPATVVLVTHRLGPLAAADEVVMLDGGAVSARGTHDWLVEHHPPYAQALHAEGGS